MRPENPPYCAMATTTFNQPIPLDLRPVGGTISFAVDLLYLYVDPRIRLG